MPAAKPRARKGLKELTPKDLGLVDGTQLSKSFSNTRKCFKIVEDNILGYYTIPNMRGPARVAPIYRAQIWVRDKKAVTVYTSHEVGEYLNSYEDDDVAPTGRNIANLVTQSIATLETWSAGRKGYLSADI